MKSKRATAPAYPRSAADEGTTGPVRTIGVFEGRRNNLDFVRLFLAILVIFSHSYPLGLGTEKNEPFMLATNGQITGGSIAVDCFFILSGFLIAHSFIYSKSLLDYFRKRVFRIYPAFIVAMLFGALLIAPIAGAVWPSSSLIARIVNFVGNTLRLREFNYADAFAKNPAPGAINGSTWSIQYEFWCYVGVAVLGVFGFLKKRHIVQALFWISIGISLFFVLSGWNPGGWVFGRIFGYPPFWARLLPMYLAGMVFYLYRERIPHRASLAAGALILLLISSAIPFGWTVTLPIAGTYLLFWVGYHPRLHLHNFGRFGDFSYGTYLYAFPIQQMTMRWFGHPVSPWTLFAVACPVTLLFAFVSWHCVEHWFLTPAKKSASNRAESEKSSQKSRTSGAPWVTGSVAAAGSSHSPE